MTLRSLLATLLALLGVWHIAMRVYFALFTILNWQFFSNHWHLISMALVLGVDLGLIFQRWRLAGLILGSGGDNLRIEERGLLAVGCAGLGAYLFLLVFTEMCIGMSWSSHYGLRCTIAVFLIVGARWMPFCLGWGRFDPGPVEDSPR
jgi:hypothetical protein